MREWLTKPLGEVADVIDSLHRTPNYSSSGYPMVRVTDIRPGELKVDNCLLVDEVTYRDFISRRKPQAGDIVFSRVGSYGVSAFVKRAMNFCLGQNTTFIVPKQDPAYLYYFLNSPSAKEQIEAFVGGSTQATISLASIKQIQVPVPDPDEQRAIAEVLSSLDDKIDLLHRQNKILESLAQTLFRQWFIEQADPSWKEGALADLSDNIRENVHQSNISAGTKYVGLEHIERKHLALYSVGISDGLGSNKSVFRRHDILFGKLRPYFHKVCFAPFDGVCSTDILVIRPKDELYFPFCLLAYFQKEVVDHSDLASEGTRMPRTNWQILGSYPIYLPDAQTLGRFNDLAEPSILKIERNLKQIESLERIRDTLLPGLMSGSISANRG